MNLYFLDLFACRIVSTNCTTSSRKLKKPEHFDEVYFSWINGGMTMEEAAMLLGITEKRFYRLTEAEG